MYGLIELMASSVRKFIASEHHTYRLVVDDG
jgi:hypothetical protein